MGFAPIRSPVFAAGAFAPPILPGLRPGIGWKTGLPSADSRRSDEWELAMLLIEPAVRPALIPIEKW